MLQLLADSIQSEGGSEAVSLKVAEQYLDRCVAGSACGAVPVGKQHLWASSTWARWAPPLSCSHASHAIV